jgi:ATP-dependent RNA helicase RhlE
MSFSSFSLSPQILNSLQDQGYVEATPIQQKAIPIILEGKDILACAQTGTGKTAAFSLPIIELLTRKNIPQKGKKISALILTPTRELAIQIKENVDVYAKNTPLKCAVIFGGVPQAAQVSTIKNGVDILIATPGRLIDLIQQKLLNIQNIEFFVLDEADRMLDMGFINDIEKIIKIIPKKRQTLFFSATMPPAIKSLANNILNQPEEIAITPVSSTANTINQLLFKVDKDNKLWLLIDLIKSNNMQTVLVFTRTKFGADKVVKKLDKYKIKSEAIHGNKSQNARQRALNNFKDGTTTVLVATDIAARGIDVDQLQHVINFEIPNEPETYVHRIGRTGRAGASGTAYSFCDIDEVEYIKRIEKLIQKPIPEATHPFPMMNFTPTPPALPKNKRNFNRKR